MDDITFLSLMGFEPVKMVRTIDCPCGAQMQLAQSTQFQWKNGTPKLMFVCIQCGTKHGAHPDGRPLGIPTNDPILKALRHECHQLMDQLSGTTQSKYNRIAQMMGVKELHFGSLDIIGCHCARECLVRALNRDKYNRLRQKAKGIKS